MRWRQDLFLKSHALIPLQNNRLLKSFELLENNQFNHIT